MKPSNANALALGAIGGYLVAVGYHENGKTLLTNLGEEKRFLKFGAALVVLNYSLDNFVQDSGVRTIGKVFLWTALLMTASENNNLFDKFNSLFK